MYNAIPLGSGRGGGTSKASLNSNFFHELPTFKHETGRKQCIRALNCGVPHALSQLPPQNPLSLSDYYAYRLAFWSLEVVFTI